MKTLDLEEGSVKEADREHISGQEDVNLCEREEQIGRKRIIK